jgi:hypothetical protein
VVGDAPGGWNREPGRAANARNLDPARLEWRDNSIDYRRGGTVTTQTRFVTASILLASAFCLSSGISMPGAAQRPPEAGQRTYQPSDISIGLERTPCFGGCPVYRLTVSGDGTVEYQGTRFVDTIGAARGTVDVDQVVLLVNEFLRVRFFGAMDRYAGEERVRRSGSGFLLESITVTDLPSQILTLKLGDRSKRVVLYDNVPVELAALPDLVDRTLRADQWVRKPK